LAFTILCCTNLTGKNILFLGIKFLIFGMQDFVCLLIDDDFDDHEIFAIALNDADKTYKCVTAKNGVDALEKLNTDETFIPDYIFLDLNMPRKTGQECLVEIRRNDKFKNLPVIIYSTSLDMVDVLYEKGAHYYIRKPAEFSHLKKVILKAITAISENQERPSKENFIIQP